MCKDYVDRFVDYSSDWSWVSLLSIAGAVGGFTCCRVLVELECVKHYEDVITCSVQGTLEIFSDT